MAQQRQPRGNNLTLALILAGFLCQVVAGIYLSSLFWIGLSNTGMQVIINGVTPSRFEQALGAGFQLSSILTFLLGTPLLLAGWGLAHVLTSRRFAPMATLISAAGIFHFYTLFGFVFRQTDRLDALQTPLAFLSPVIMAVVFGLGAAAIISRVGYEQD